MQKLIKEAFEAELYFIIIFFNSDFLNIKIKLDEIKI